MADEIKNTGLGAGEQGWLRRQRAAESRMIGDRKKRDEIMRIRKQHRERVEAEMAARANGESEPDTEVEAEPFDYRNKEGFEMPTGNEEEPEQEDTPEESDESSEEDPSPDEDAPFVGDSSEGDDSDEEEEENFKDVQDMSRQELNRELKERGQPVVGKPNLDKLRKTLSNVRSGGAV